MDGGVDGGLMDIAQIELMGVVLILYVALLVVAFSINLCCWWRLVEAARWLLRGRFRCRTFGRLWS